MLVEFTSVSFPSVNPRLAIDLAGRIMTDRYSLLFTEVTLNLGVTQYI